MRWLLWKDYRHNRPVVITGLVLLLVPHVFAIYAAVSSKATLSGWGGYLAESGIYSLAISQMTVALIGGNAIAGERVDRSAEFLASLPITRGKILASKLLFALTVVAAIWLINACAFCPLLATVRHLPPMEARYYEDFPPMVAHIAMTGLLFFCVAWLFSSFLASPTYSVFAGLATPVLFFLTTDLIGRVFGAWRIASAAELSYRTFCLSFSPVCFAIGTWYYLRRVEP